MFKKGNKIWKLSSGGFKKGNELYKLSSGNTGNTASKVTRDKMRISHIGIHAG